MTKRCTAWHIGGRKRFIECRVCGKFYYRATPHNSRLTAQAPLRQLRHGICVAKMLDNVGLRYPHRASGAKAPRTLRPLPLLRFAVSATGGAHLCSIQYYLRFWLGICRTSLAVSALRIMRYCLRESLRIPEAFPSRFVPVPNPIPHFPASQLRPAANS